MTELPAEPTFRERLGGRWAISWQAFVITVPIAIAAVVVGNTRSWADVPEWIIVGLIAALMAGAWVYLMHRTAFRNRAMQPVTLAWAIALPVITISIAIAGTMLASEALGLPGESERLTRALPTLLVGTFWSIAIALFFEARWRFGREREALVERAVQQQLAAMQEAEVADRIRESLRTEIADQLAQTRASIDERLATFEQDSANSGAAASQLREAAAKAVRPLSHELAQRAAQAHPRPGVVAVLRNIVERQPFRPLPVSIIYLVTTSPTEIEKRGWTEGLFALVLTVALIWLTMSIANWAMRRWPRHHAALFITGIALIEAPSLLLPPVVAAVTSTTVDWRGAFVSVGFGIILIVITSGFGSLRASRRDLLRTFATDVNQEEVATVARSRALATAAREAAGVLHGPVQTKLVACAMAIEHAAEARDVIAMNQALVQARAVLEQPVPALAADPQSTIAAEVDRKAALWRGLVDVTIDIEPTVAAVGGQVASDVGAVVEEGIANAIQHGAATAVIVAITHGPDTIVVRVTDNGSGPVDGPAGLGSQLLDRLAPGWQLTQTSLGACLRASIARPTRTSAVGTHERLFAPILTALDLNPPAEK